MTQSTETAIFDFLGIKLIRVFIFCSIVSIVVCLH